MPFLIDFAAGSYRKRGCYSQGEKQPVNISMPGVIAVCNKAIGFITFPANETSISLPLAVIQKQGASQGHRNSLS